MQSLLKSYDHMISLYYQGILDFPSQK